MKRVLVVEDDSAMAVALKEGLEFQGYTAEVAGDGAAGFRLAAEKSFDLVILDVMLPRLSGIEVCKRLRAHDRRLPIVMLTARGQEIDKVMGLKTGADDYVTKPFGFMELLARIEAVLRRSDRGAAEAPLANYRCDGLAIDFDAMTVSRNGRAHELTARECRLLRFLLERRGRVVTRDQLLDGVWGHAGAPLTRTVDVHVAKLRKKIERRPAWPEHLVTVHGAGYTWRG